MLAKEAASKKDSLKSVMQSSTPRGVFVGTRNNVPRINPVSEMIVMKKSPEKRANVWEHLYELDKPQSEKRDQLHLRKKIEEEENSLKECTFRPVLGMQSCKARNASLSGTNDIYKRTQQWKKTIDQR